MSTDCIFCKISKGEIKTEFVYESDKIVVFKDLNPQAPAHLLIIPREHIASVNDVEKWHNEMLGGLWLAARDIAGKLGLSDNGYRLVVNTGKDSGQEVMHIHMHLLAGRKLKWPPG